MDVGHPLCHVTSEAQPLEISQLRRILGITDAAQEAIQRASLAVLHYQTRLPLACHHTNHF